MTFLQSTNTGTYNFRSSHCGLVTVLAILLFIELNRNSRVPISLGKWRTRPNSFFGRARKNGSNHVGDSKLIQSFMNMDASGCDNSTSLFGNHGEACIDFDYAASKQVIYGLNTKNISYLVCAIPKNGCTYHLALMHRLLGFKYRGAESVHGPLNVGRLKVSGEVLKRMITDPNIEKYVVVRNPLERVLSAYLNKVEIKIEQKKRGSDTFKEWAYRELYPGMEDNNSINPHWKPQVSFCGFKMRDAWKGFRQFKVEKPGEYVDYLEKLLPQWVMKGGWNGTANASFREAALGRRARTEHTSKKFFRYVRSLNFFDYLVSCYRVDIERFGYEHDIEQMRAHLDSSIKIHDANDT